MIRWCLVALFLSLGLSLASVTSTFNRASESGRQADAKNTKGVITPELDRCTLNVEDHAFKPVRVSSANLAEHRVGHLRIQLEGASISAFNLGEQKPQWTATAPGATNLAWLAAGDKVIYLAGYKVEKQPEAERPDSPLRGRCLELASGKWLDDLAVDGKPGPEETEAIQAALIHGGHVIVLTVTTKNDSGWPGTGQLISYRVSCFMSGAKRSLWSRTYPSAGELAQPGAILLSSARTPGKVQPDVQPLASLGEDVLVCAGPVQDLLCLEGSTGKQRWRVERVWEYERGFIGPSVWQHFISRFGVDRFGAGVGEKKDEDKKGSLARRYAIVGGPIVVDLAKGRGDGDRRIFVAVAKGPAQFGEYLSDCVVYELGSDGQPLAMANLPRMIQGGWFQIQKDGVVWACQTGAFVKLGVSPNGGIGIGMGPGGPDLLCRVDWYRQLSPEEPDAWLRADPAGDPVAFGDAFAFRVCAGGYVTEPNAGIYHFPISMVDLRTGTDRAMVLRVPFKGKLPAPKTNYSGIITPQGKARWKTMGPHVLAITWLQVEDNRLRVTVGMEEWARSLEFDLDEIQGRKRK